jgi:hypothetical protein
VVLRGLVLLLMLANAPPGALRIVVISGRACRRAVLLAVYPMATYSYTQATARRQNEYGTQRMDGLPSVKIVVRATMTHRCLFCSQPNGAS